MAAPPFKVKALYDYNSQEEDDLRFSSSQIITVTDEEDADWYYGEYDDNGTKQEGLFPKNFVKLLEPEAPPRPSRSMKAKKDQDVGAEMRIKEHEAEERSSKPSQEDQHAIPRAVTEEESQTEMPIPSSSPRAPEEPTDPAPVLASTLSSQKPVPPATSKPVPPAADKVSSNAFRDRINAFNKPTAPPVAPVKPGNLSSSSGSGFVKKPFVAPPPSKNAYVAPPRETPPQKVYRREEDPEVLAQSHQSSSEAQRSPEPDDTPAAEEDDQPKPTSLKDRIAQLQKQQMEQAARQAEATQKKEKAKKSRPSEAAGNLDSDADPTVAAPDKAGRAASDARSPTDTEQKRRQSREAPARPSEEFRHSKDILSDGNDADQSGAGDTEDGDEVSTGHDDSDNRPARKISTTTASSSQRLRSEHGMKQEEPKSSDEETAGEGDEEIVDPEVKRRMEIRERMAKMSGGMGMAGMFGPPGGLSSKASTKKTSTAGKYSGRDGAATEGPTAKVNPVPIMPLPGPHKVRHPDDQGDENVVSKEDEIPQRAQLNAAGAEGTPDIETVVQSSPGDEGRHSQEVEDVKRSQDRPAPPPPPQARMPPLPPSERPVPPPPASRPVPPPPPQQLLSPTDGSESDDELSSHDRRALSGEGSRPSSREGPTALATAVHASDATIAQAPTNERSVHDAHSSSAISSLPSPPESKIPLSAVEPTRRSMSGGKAFAHDKLNRHKQESDEEITEYEGDYDTDIAPGAPHKDALKAHARSPSLEDDSLVGETHTGNVGLSSPGPATSHAPRAVPPPPPPNQPPKKRQSSDAPRAVPPPPPPPKQGVAVAEEDYDPFRYSDPVHGLSSPRREEESFTRTPTVEEPEHIVAPNPPQHHRQLSQDLVSQQSPASSLANPTNPEHRQSTDLRRTSMPVRQSADLARQSGEHFIASDLELGHASQWWTHPNTPPPILQNRRDVVFEIDESSTSRRGGKITITKDIYVLFMDYSQTTISVQFENTDPNSATKLEQKHEPPPRSLRQDELEKAHESFGGRVAEMAKSKEGAVLGDGTPHTLVHELITSIPEALPPVGLRAYGALVYANLANATVQQHDEIRPGDILTFRNAKFGGHRGPMKSKYSAEVGKPDHVGVVVDWDGSKKKIRAWEQGRESKKVKIESFKLGDMKSGEVKVWRVMSREYVNWK